MQHGSYSSGMGLLDIDEFGQILKVSLWASEVAE